MKKVLFLSGLLLVLPGCTTRESDIVQIMVGGTWSFYMVALVIIYYLSQVRLPNSIMFAGLIVSLILSSAVPFFVPGEGGVGVLILFGPIVGLLFSPLIFLYSYILFCLFKMFNVNQYGIIPYYCAFPMSLQYS